MSENKVKTFQSGTEKLRFEQKQCLDGINEKYRDMARKQYDAVFTALIWRCEKEKEFDALVLQEHKSWSGCMKYAASKAMELTNPTDKQKELARKGERPIVAPVDGTMLFRWIDEYYHNDDKDDKREQKPKAKKEKAATENAISPKQEAGTADTVKKNGNRKKENPAHEKKKAKKRQDTEGQMSLFDFM